MAKGVDFSKMSNMGKKAKKADEPHEPNGNREEVFRTKVAMQQFMNHNGPLFRAFAYKGIDVSEVSDGTILLGPTEEASKLTRLVASAVLDKPVGDLTAKDTAPFRTEAAQWVATRWGRNEPWDVEAAAAEIAAAVKTAGEEWAHDPWKDDRITNDASMMMSAAGVTGILMKQVAIYDFRIGKNKVLAMLLDAVITNSTKVSAEMLKGGGRSDVANLTQTVARNLTVLMEAIYERKAREVVTVIADKSLEERVAWLKINNPLGQILDEFKTWSMCFVGFAVATSTRMNPASTAQPKAGSLER